MKPPLVDSGVWMNWVVAPYFRMSRWLVKTHHSIGSTYFVDSEFHRTSLQGPNQTCFTSKRGPGGCRFFRLPTGATNAAVAE